MNVLLFMTLGLSTIVLMVSGYGCDRSRTVLNSSRGIISDGSGIGKNYTADTHCEWLIVGNDTHRFISLMFKSLNTECAFDYIFVYDGGGEMLGSFSGAGGIPEAPLVSSTGSMRLLFYSDTNYVLEGFTA